MSFDIEGKYLTFGLGKQEYGARILSVKEIIGMMPIRALPQTPPFFKGVLNLRDKVIPVIDLRLKFGMEELEYNERTCIIIMEFWKKDGTFQLGAVVDSVFEVLNVKAADIEDTPTFGVDIDTNFILGIVKMDEGVKILLDTDLILAAGEGEIIANVS